MAGDRSEQALAESVRSMLADPEWLLPLVAAQRQFRSSYYGLTSAALLEDVWFDALANWLHREEPSTPIRRPKRGQDAEAGDYVVGDQAFGHKSGDGPGTVGVHWDAVAAAEHEEEPWTSEVPIVLLSSGYAGVTGRWTPDGTTQTFSCRATWKPSKKTPRRQVLALVSWARDGSASILHTWDSSPSFTNLWPMLAIAAKAIPLNNLDLLWVPRALLASGDRGRLTWTARPGCYIFSASVLRSGVPAGGNNRARTLSRNTVIELMQGAVEQDLWAPMPMWYANFAPPRPPDLYLPLRAQFDGRFSHDAWEEARASDEANLTQAV